MMVLSEPPPRAALERGLFGRMQVMSDAPVYHDDANIPSRSLTSYDPFTNRPLAQIFPLSPSDHSQSTSFGRQDQRLQSTVPTSSTPTTLCMDENLSMIVPLHQIQTAPESGVSYISHGSSRRASQESYYLEQDSPTRAQSLDYEVERSSQRGMPTSRTLHIHQTRRRPYNQDEFDGPCHLLPSPMPHAIMERQRDLPILPTNLNAHEQSEILNHINRILSQAAFHFVAHYQFPIPDERDKPRVESPEDREWTEWAHLLIRLATKRRIPKKCLYDNQITAFVTVINNSIEPRYNKEHPRPLKDDRNVLQSISSAMQVAKIVMDAAAMEQLDNLYVRTEIHIIQKKATASGNFLR